MSRLGMWCTGRISAGRRQALTHVHLAELVHRAGVRHMLKDEFQECPVTGGNGQLLLASALHHTVWDVSKGV